MPREVKRTVEAEGRPSSFSSLLLGWTQQGIDSFLATQRILADFATNKSAGALKSLQEGISDIEGSPVAILTELAAEGTATFTEAQRVLLTLAEQESGIAMDGIEQGVAGSAAAVSVTKRLRNSINALLQMQQEFLTLVNKHAQEGLKNSKAGKMPDGSCMVDAARDVMDNLVRTQKKLLDVAVEEAAKSKGKGDDGKKKTNLSTLAREAATSFIDAQKSLLDLAGQQVNVGLQATTRVAEMTKMFRMNPFPTITGDGVKSFVDAEKAVLDSLIRPKKGAKKRASAPKRRAGRRAPMAEAAKATG
jgi:hypothetical protein